MSAVRRLRARRVAGSSLLAGASIALALLALPGPSAANPPPIGPPQPELTSLAEKAVHLLDAHLSPAVTVTYKIGYDLSSPAGNATPAITTNTEYGCQIAVNEEAFNHDAAGNANWELEIITHEMFHCYEVQIERTENYAHVANTEAWVQEGLARWVDMTLFSSDPIAESRESLKTYFATSTVSLFARRYDAVGFWGHLQDVSGDLWLRIPRILEAAVEGSKQALDTALSGTLRRRVLRQLGIERGQRHHRRQAVDGPQPVPVVRLLGAAAPDQPGRPRLAGRR